MRKIHWAPVAAATYLDAVLTDAADDLAYAESIRPAGTFAYFGQAAV